jgi:hypothetical protein
METMNGVKVHKKEAPLDRALRYSKASRERMAAMQAALEMIDQRKIGGDIVECGVWRGGHLILARLLSPKRKCWAYDTFEGMTEPGPHDVKRSGHTAKELLDAKPNKRMSYASLTEVQDYFASEGVLDHSLVRFVVGDVAKTLLQPVNLPDKIAILRLDTDWYESTKIEMEILYPRLVKGGFLIIDDYGHWMGARKAVQEYFSLNGWDAQKLRPIDYTAVMMVKGV